MAYTSIAGMVKHFETVGELLAQLREPCKVVVTLPINEDDTLTVDAVKKDVILALSVRDEDTPVEAYIHFPSNTVFIN